MPKKARMGRNLDALLGGARDRRRPEPDNDAQAEASDTASVQDSDVGVAAEAATVENPTDVVTAVDAPVVNDAASTAVVDVERPVEGDRLSQLSVDQIRRGTYQPRRHFDPDLLQELANSLLAQGMINPVLVRPFAGAYELVAGERRWRAAQLAGLRKIPAIIRQMEDRSVAAVALIENIQRKDLNPLEEADALHRLCAEFDMTHQQVAAAVGRSRAAVTNLLRLLELDDEVKLLVDRGEIDMGHARALLGAPPERQFELARRIVDESMSVRAAEKMIRELDIQRKPPAAAPPTDPDIERLRSSLGDILGASVQIRHKPGGAGKLEIAYTSVAELEGILAHIR